MTATAAAVDSSAAAFVAAAAAAAAQEQLRRNSCAVGFDGAQCPELGLAGWAGPPPAVRQPADNRCRQRAHQLRDHLAGLHTCQSSANQVPITCQSTVNQVSTF